MASPNPYGQIVDTSASGGLKVNEMWAKLFRDNEKAFEEDRSAAVLLDEVIAQEMHLAFPSRQSHSFTRVKEARINYNRGIGFPSGLPPIVQSFRYLRDAQGKVFRVTARGKRIG